MNGRALYLMYAEDVDHSEALRAPLREAHIRRRAELAAQGRVVVSGPLWDSDAAQGDYCGSLLVAAFDSLAQAQAWADADPYARAGIYRRMVVRRINTHFLAQESSP
ncbi:hypothetical protein CDO44_24035 [Pigmentiphaga sp. NML080357]|uniref:YciI family protein n=1 Tax=Pigmentiphaga sp. NML080357 TaxID=2008675 RepID=UPI000B419ED7|nr:YciI family protein [Pigmentiphaga sp. NML080357]OVZ55296.1 hypothetical protein CDO44_24035 [Pigmentiphaga sp. NML080357]